jgi:arylsulfatase A-like enzyme
MGCPFDCLSAFLLESYDLENDPYELNNLAGDPSYQQKINDYRVKLKAWMKQQGDTGRIWI